MDAASLPPGMAENHHACCTKWHMFVIGVIAGELLFCRVVLLTNEGIDFSSN